MSQDSGRRCRPRPPTPESLLGTSVIVGFINAAVVGGLPKGGGGSSHHPDGGVGGAAQHPG